MKRQLTIYILPDIKKQGEEVAKSKGLSLSSLISLLITEAKKKLDKDKNRE